MVEVINEVIGIKKYHDKIVATKKADNGGYELTVWWKDGEEVKKAKVLTPERPFGSHAFYSDSEGVYIFWAVNGAVMRAKIANDGTASTPEKVVKTNGFPEVAVYGSALLWYDGDWKKLDLAGQSQEVPFSLNSIAFAWNNIFEISTGGDHRTRELRWYHGEHRSIAFCDWWDTWSGGVWCGYQGGDCDVIEFFDWSGNRVYGASVGPVADADIHNGYAVFVGENPTVILKDTQNRETKVQTVSIPEEHKEDWGEYVVVSHGYIYYMSNGKLYRIPLQV